MLLIIMILFRPTNNNQRFAFTPLLDESDEDDDEIIYIPEGLNQNLKMRNTADNQDKILFDRTNKNAQNKKKNEEEFSTFVDSAFPLLIDSEDELVNKELELSKMN